MKLWERLESGGAHGGPSYRIHLYHNSRVIWWVKGSTLSDRTIDDWSSAEQSVQRECEHLYPGAVRTPVLQRCVWRQATPGQTLWHEVSSWLFEGASAPEVSWKVTVYRRREHSSRPVASTTYEQTGGATTWEGAIEAGRAALEALASIPYPGTEVSQ